MRNYRERAAIIPAPRRAVQSSMGLSLTARKKFSDRAMLAGDRDARRLIELGMGMMPSIYSRRRRVSARVITMAAINAIRLVCRATRHVGRTRSRVSLALVGEARNSQATRLISIASLLAWRHAGGAARYSIVSR